MTPYYKAVVSGKNPDPRDWCGVFVSLHEREGFGPLTPAGDGHPNNGGTGRAFSGASDTPIIGGGGGQNGHFRERVYAYNIYRGGDFSSDVPQVRVGNSYLGSDGEGTLWQWHLNARERCLWRGEVRLDGTFTTAGLPPSLPPIGDKGENADHTWVCVAPVCHANVRFTLANGSIIAFTGQGYHDHNFGHLPWRDIEGWYWGRGSLTGNDGNARHLLYYATERKNAGTEALVMVHQGQNLELLEQEAPTRLLTPSRNRFQLNYAKQLEIQGQNQSVWGVTYEPEIGCFADGPFYRRLPIHITRRSAGESEAGTGIGEVFQPARLLGPIASQAIWTRMRRR